MAENAENAIALLIQHFIHWGLYVYSCGGSVCMSVRHFVVSYQSKNGWLSSLTVSHFHYLLPF